MNIVFITNTLNQVGGIERFITIWSDYFIEHLNYNVVIVDIHSENFNGFFTLNKKVNIEMLKIKTLDDFSLKGKLSKMKEINEKVSSVVKKYKCDILFTFQHSISRYILSNKKQFKKSKIIVTEHNSHNVYSKKQTILNLLAYRRADKVVVFTESEKQYYKKFADTIKIPHANSFKSKNISNSNIKRIIAVGRLEEIKGYRNLIDAFEIVCKIDKEWILNIIGDGSQKLELEAKIKQKGLSKRIQILPFTDKIKDEYLNSSIFALSSKFEGFGLVLIEAMECGLPVVSFNISAAQEILSNHEDSLLVNSFNVEEYAEALLSLMNSREKRVNMGKMARANAEKYSIDNIANQWVNLFNELKT